jgi:hypothetical protein
VDELRDHPRRRRRGLARIDDRVGVTVRREAHIVELDLVEARTRRDLGDRDVVVPDAAVVRVRPAEPRMVAPDRAAGRPDREVRPALGEPRILEDDHASDQVDAPGVRRGRQLPWLVVRPRRAYLRRQRNRRGDEADLAVLVLDVELDRVQAFARQVQVLREPAVERGEGHRHVHAADLDGQRTELRDRRLRLDRGLRRRPDDGLIARDHLRARRHAEKPGEEDPDRDQAPAPLPPPCGCPPGTKALVRFQRLEEHRHGRGNGTRSRPLPQPGS